MRACRGAGAGSRTRPQHHPALRGRGTVAADQEPPVPRLPRGNGAESARAARRGLAPDAGRPTRRPGRRPADESGSKTSTRWSGSTSTSCSPPGPVPPVPVPHPFVGLVMDPFDYLPLVGATGDGQRPAAHPGQHRRGGPARAHPIGGMFASLRATRARSSGSATWLIDGGRPPIWPCPRSAGQDIG